jgi:preprotein translocase subunit SecY
MAVDKRINKNFRTIFKEIFTNKNVLIALGITLFLIMLFHLASIVTVPGIGGVSENAGNKTPFTDMLNLLAGGGLSKISLFAVGVGPYITAQIIVQLLSTDLIKPMSKMAKMGERGRKKLEIITRFITLPFALAQAYAVLALLLNSNNSGITIFDKSTLGELSGLQIFTLLMIFTAGTYLSIFMGDIITKRGVGNGITLLILSGIVSSIIANFTSAFERISQQLNHGSDTYTFTIILSFTLYILFFVVLLLAIIFINGSIRKIPVQQTGQGLVTQMDDLPFLPIKLNSAGVIPVIFASSILTIPGTVAQFLSEDNLSKEFILKYLTLQSPSGLAIYFVMIILFTFFYSYIQLNPQQLSENFEKSGKFIPGVKTGIETEKHITKVLNRVN